MLPAALSVYTPSANGLAAFTVEAPDSFAVSRHRIYGCLRRLRPRSGKQLHWEHIPAPQTLIGSAGRVVVEGSDANLVIQHARFWCL